MTTTELDVRQDDKRRGRKARRLGAGLVLAGVGTLGLLAVSGPAFAAGGSLSNIWLHPGGEACTAAYASSSVYATGSAKSPGLKFKIIAQNGTVVAGTASPGPVTGWSAQTGVGY